MASRGWSAALFIGVVLALSGCGDPYERELNLTLYPEGEAKRIASRLGPEDGELFVRWAARMATPDRFPGEGTPVTVRGALINQRRFEEVAQENAAKEARLAAEEKAKADEVAAQQAAYDLELQALQKTHDLISQLVKTEFTSFEFAPIFNRYGLEVGREWKLHFKVTNDTNGELVGLKGPLAIYDTFKKELGYVEARLETSIQSGQTKEEVLVITYDKRLPMHQAMRESNTLRALWYFQSLALMDGRVVDASNIDEIIKSEAEANAVDQEAAPPTPPGSE